MTGKTKTPQVQISIMDDSGEWYQPHQVPAVLAALPAIGEDIEQYSGSYSDESLRDIRAALRDLDEVLSRRIGPA